MNKKGASVKGCFKKTSGDKKVLNFQFNPNSIDTKRGVNYKDFQGCGSPYPKLQYTGADGEEISFALELFNDTKKVKETVDYIESLLPPKDVTAKFQVPPSFYFAFGEAFTEECVLLGKDIEYDDFDSKLAPRGAKIKIKLRVVK